MVEREVPDTLGDQKEERYVDTEGAGLDGAIHTDLKHTGRPEEPQEHQQLQH